MHTDSVRRKVFYNVVAESIITIQVAADHANKLTCRLKSANGNRFATMSQGQKHGMTGHLTHGFI